MTILSEPAAAGHSPKGFRTVIGPMIERWSQRVAERRTIAILQALDPELVKDIGGAAAYLAEKAGWPANPGRSAVGPLLAAYLPYWGRGAAGDARERQR